MTVTVKDNGALAFVQGAASMREPLGVDAGVIGDKAQAIHTGEQTVAAIAEMHEFGVGVPQRSWLRDWVAANRREVLDRLRRVAADGVRGRTTPEKGLERLGLWVQGQLQANIAAGISPENAPATIARKGSSTPLIDQGQFRQSISSEVR